MTEEMQAVRKVLIVGGGTAGWLAAAVLSRALGQTIEVTVLHSPAVATVGVGEATVPTMVNTLRFLGIDEATFLRRCGGSYKAAIKYKNWRHGGVGPVPDEFFHPFFERPETLVAPFGERHFPLVGEGLSTADLWSSLPAPRPRFDAIASPIAELSTHNQFGPGLGTETALQYAYHLDAQLFAELLRENAMARGAKQVLAHVASVQKDAQGYISSVSTREGDRWEADFFIDCTGFRSLLLGGTLDEPFRSDSDYLACDSAVAIQVPTNPGQEGLPPYTQATALRHGWSWQVPLQQRNGCGYVYSSAHCSAEEAERELRALLGTDLADEPARHLKLRVGRHENTWVNNCLALGLSSSFLEPLESTAIFMLEYQLAQLLNHFPSRRFAAARRSRYNRVINEMYDHLRDFIVMHYWTSQRRDTPFWRQVTEGMPVPDTLTSIIEEYRQGVLPQDALEFRLFRSRSYVSILSGMGIEPEFALPLAQHLTPQVVDAELTRLRTQRKRYCTELPRHVDYLSQKCAEAEGLSQ